VPRDQAFRHREMFLGNFGHFEHAGGHIRKQTLALQRGRSLLQHAGANLHRESRLHLNESNSRDSDFSVRFAENRGNTLGTDFGVIVLDQCAGIEEVLRQSVFPTIRDEIRGKRARYNRKRSAHLFY